MREIKFRGREYDARYGLRWVYGDLTHKFVQILVAGCIVEETTVGQFTGLKDKDGKEIYEGDIIEALGERADVVFDVATGCFAAYPPSGPCELYRVSDDSRVIGNIYDNLELLRGDGNA